MTASLATLVCGLALGFPTLRILRRLHVIDKPSPRSLHNEAIPRAGGVATLLVGAAGFAISNSSHDVKISLLLASTFGILGLVDDLITLPAMPRLCIQFMCGIFIVPILLSSISAPAPLKALISLGALLWIVALVNAVNFMDGINGLSSAQAMIAGVTWYIVGNIIHAQGFAESSLVLAAAAAAFAPFNFPRPRMFLGDVGSYALGSWLAVLTIGGLVAGATPEAMVGPLALYLADTATTLLRRFRRGERLHEPHRSHTYQRLVLGGWSHTRTTSVLAAMISLLSALGLATLQAPRAYRLLVLVLMFGILGTYVALPALLEARRQGQAS